MNGATPPLTIVTLAEPDGVLQNASTEEDESCNCNGSPIVEGTSKVHPLSSVIVTL